MREFMHQTPRPEMSQQKILRLSLAQTCIDSIYFSGSDHLDHRRAMTHADAAHALDGNLGPGLSRAFLQCVKQPVAALGHAAGTESDVNSGRTVRPRQKFFGRTGEFGRLFGLQKLGDDLWCASGSQMAGGRFANPNHGCQRAATQAGDWLDGEQSLRVGVFAGLDMKVTSEGIFYSFGAGYVTGCAVTNAHHMT